MSGSGSSSWQTGATTTSTKGSEAQSCETICSMLAMLSCSEKLDAQRALLAMTTSPESCQSLRRAGCIPLLIQILHPGSATPMESHPSNETKLRASQALKNIVHFNPDKKMKRRESTILILLEAVRGFTSSTNLPEPENHPTRSSTSLMKHSFDQEHKIAMCTLGAIHAIADLIVSDHKIHGFQTTDADCILTRRYSFMTLTNLTFGDSMNKALLCSMRDFLHSLVSQLECQNEEVVHVTASVLRNLSWHADPNSRAALRDSKVVSGLTKAALRATKEPTLEAILSALWNLSAHSSVNKAAICSSPKALKFLMSLLKQYKSPTMVENAGGILRNISSHITEVDEYRVVLHECHCFEIILEHLKSSSLTIVSNACGILWNISIHPEEQRKLLQLNAVPMLKSLTNSKHERISQGSAAALRNLLSYSELTNELPIQSQSYISKEQENDEPLDLTIISCKSSPIRKSIRPPFLNPPISNNGSISSTRSCPEIQLKQQQAQNSEPKQHTHPHPPQPDQQKLDASSEDTTVNYSNYDEIEEEEEEDGEEKHQQNKDTIKTYCDEGTPGFSGSMVDLSIQTVDSLIQFQVEDTPALFSRTSSLSSIEEKDSQHGENRAEKNQESTKPSGLRIPNQQCTEQSSVYISNSNSSVTNPTVIPKRVMFSAEETPLMFSRSSSVASLESCGDLNLNNGRESDCVSEFSRRTSEVVSPSEPPDSPRVADQEHTAGPPDQPEEQNRSNFIEVCSPKKQATATANDELKVFAMEGTPFLISTATSLSDIVDEMDNQPINLSNSNHHHQILPVSTASKNKISVIHIQTLTPEQTAQHGLKEQERLQIHHNINDDSQVITGLSSQLSTTVETEPEEPIYSDAQLLQKVIKVGRAASVGVGLPKRLSLHFPIPVVQQQYQNQQQLHLGGVEDNEIDLSHLIQRGRAKLIMTRSEDNLKQYHNSHEILGRFKACNENQTRTVTDIKSEVLQIGNNDNADIKIENPQSNTVVDEIVMDTRNLIITPRIDIENNSSHDQNVCDVARGQSENLPKITPTSTAGPKNNYYSDEAIDLDIDTADNTDDNTEEISQSERTWTDETLSFSSPIPSMSINKALEKVVGGMAETLSEIEEPTLHSLGTLDSTGNGNGLIKMEGQHSPASYSKPMESGPGFLSTQNISLLHSNSSQVSNLMNQKPPQDFFDLHSSMISVASIKSEIFDDSISPCFSSPQLSSHRKKTDVSLIMKSSPHESKDKIIETSPRSPPPSKVLTSASPSKYNTYVIKRVESPRERRKNNPDRYLTRTIDRADLKMKSVVPLKRFSSPSPTSVSPAPVSTVITITATLPQQTTTMATVRPTRTSELRASRSREHSPTNSTSSLSNTLTSKIPAKLPIVRPSRSLNTSLPRNAKLMETANVYITTSAVTQSRTIVGSKHHSSNKGTQQKEKEKLNFGGRIGNLFRRSFSGKNNEKKQLKRPEVISGPGNIVWAKNREKEKCLVSPFNYTPPTINPTGTVKSVSVSAAHSGEAPTVYSVASNNFITSTYRRNSNSGTGNGSGTTTGNLGERKTKTSSKTTSV